MFNRSLTLEKKIKPEGSEKVNKEGEEDNSSSTDETFVNEEKEDSGGDSVKSEHSNAGPLPPTEGDKWDDLTRRAKEEAMREIKGGDKQEIDENQRVIKTRGELANNNPKYVDHSSDLE